MANPILARLNTNQIDLGSILRMAKGNPQALYDNMLKSNPMFADFVKSCDGKTHDQIAREYGVNMDVLKRFM